MLELYQFEACPFSAQVRAKMSEWERIIFSGMCPMTNQEDID